MEALWLLGVLENLFRYENERGHEIVFVFEARFRDPALSEPDELTLLEAGEPHLASWVPLAELRGGQPLYPAGLLELLAGR